MPDIFKDALIALIPSLRGFAATLSGSRAEADDLVQETLFRALRYRDSFREGSDMKSWLHTILRNCFFRSRRHDRFLVEDVEGQAAARQSIGPSQEWRVRTHEILDALDRLPPDTREALLLVSTRGFSYEEAAEVSACSVGTLKSRVNRARERLAALAGDAVFDAEARPHPLS